MDGRILVAGYEPFVVGRPDERVDAVAIRKFFLRDKIVCVPKADTAEVSDCPTAARGLKRESGNGLRRMLECMRNRRVRTKSDEIFSSGREQQTRRF